MNLLIVAGGQGTRTANFTMGNFFPKIFMSLGNETILDKIVSNPLADSCDNIYVIVSTNEHVQMVKSYVSIKGYDKVLSVTSDPSKTIFGNIKEFFEKVNAKGSWVLHWSDIFSDKEGYETVKSHALESDKNFIVTDLNRRHRYCFDYASGVSLSPNSTGNIPGIYFIKDAKQITECKNSYNDIVEFFGDTYFYPPSFYSISTKVEDIGDVNKYNKYLEDNSSICRYFNSIEFDGDTVTKRALTPYGKEVMSNEIDFYMHHKSKLGITFPRVYSCSAEKGYIKMQRIEGMTVNECVEQLDKTHTNARIPRKLLSSYMAMHRAFSPSRRNISINEDIEKEYLGAMYSRVMSIECFLPEQDTDFYVDGTLVKCSRYSVYEMYEDIRTYLESIQYLWGDIHGDTNTSNVLISTPTYERGNLMFSDMYMIDPRGKFGSSKYMGDINYDIAKFLYGLSGYSNFTLDNKFTIRKDEHGYHFGLAKYGYDLNFLLRDVMLNDNTELTKKYKMLIGIIYVKLSAYTVNNIHKVIAAYVQGVKLIREALAM